MEGRSSSGPETILELERTARMEELVLEAVVVESKVVEEGEVVILEEVEEEVVDLMEVEAAVDSTTRWKDIEELPEELES